MQIDKELHRNGECGETSRFACYVATHLEDTDSSTSPVIPFFPWDNLGTEVRNQNKNQLNMAYTEMLKALNCPFKKSLTGIIP